MPKAEVGVWPLYTDLGSHSTNQCPCKLSIYFKLAPLATTERFCFCIKICGGKKKYVMGQEKKKKKGCCYIVVWHLQWTGLDFQGRTWHIYLEDGMICLTCPRMWEAVKGTVCQVAGGQTYVLGGCDESCPQERLALEQKTGLMYRNNITVY